MDEIRALLACHLPGYKVTSMVELSERVLDLSPFVRLPIKKQAAPRVELVAVGALALGRQPWRLKATSAKKRSSPSGVISIDLRN